MPRRTSHRRRFTFEPADVPTKNMTASKASDRHNRGTQFLARQRDWLNQQLTHMKPRAFPMVKFLSQSVYGPPVNESTPTSPLFLREARLVKLVSPLAGASLSIRSCVNYLIPHPDLQVLLRLPRLGVARIFLERFVLARLLEWHLQVSAP